MCGNSYLLSILLVFISFNIWRYVAHTKQSLPFSSSKCTRSWFFYCMIPYYLFLVFSLSLVQTYFITFTSYDYLTCMRVYVYACVCVCVRVCVYFTPSLLQMRAVSLESWFNYTQCVLFCVACGDVYHIHHTYSINWLVEGESGRLVAEACQFSNIYLIGKHGIHLAPKQALKKLVKLFLSSSCLVPAFILLLSWRVFSLYIYYYAFNSKYLLVFNTNVFLLDSPLFQLLARLFIFVIPFGSPAWRVGLLCALCGTFAGQFIFWSTSLYAY